MMPQSQNWDTNSDVYARNEKSMTDLEVNMIEPRHRTWIVIEDLPEVNNNMIAAAVISASKSRLIDNTI